MKSALAIVPKGLMQSALKGWLERRCLEHDIALRFLCAHETCASGWAEVFRSESNILAWNCRMSHEWMTQAKQNILFLDNALISQKRGVFVDHGGLFARSNLCRDAGEQGSHWAADFYARREFGWRAFQEGDVAGPILVCLQCEADSSVTQGFLPGRETEGRMVEFLRQVKTHLPFPSHRVIIRPHPREKPACLPSDAECGGWSWANEETFAEVLPRCRAVVTVNSTCAHEAVLAGVPVATLGTGTFTGWGVTLECAGNE